MGFTVRSLGALLLAATTTALVSGGCSGEGEESPPSAAGPRAEAAPFPGREAVLAAAPESMRACAGCHASLVHEYLQNGMADTLGPLEPASVPAAPDAGWIPSPNSGFQYRVEPADNGWHVVEGREAPRPDWPAHRRAQPLLWRIGAGVLDMSFVAVENGRWFFAPLEFFTEHGWELAPTEHRPQPHGLGRPITAECLGCHTTEAIPERFPRHALGGLEPRGLDCSACHGPGAEHVRRMQGNAEYEDPGILNPADLSPTRQLDVCSRCHLQGDARIELRPIAAGGFEPGEDLLARRAVVVAAEPDADFGFVSQTERLALSACFRASPQMTCTTCHDPHLPARLQPRAELLKACTGCHAEPHRERPVDTGSRDCIECHMRRSQPFDLEHVAVHDHWIRALPPPPEELGAIRELEAADGDFALFRYRADDEWPYDEEERRLLLAMAWAHHGAFDRARPAFERLPAADTPEARRDGGEAGLARLPMMHFMRAETLAASGETDEAIGSYRDALALDPALGSARVNLAQLLASRGDLAAARREAEAAIRAHPRMETPWNVLALVCNREGDPEGTARGFRESLARNPSQPAVWRALAQTQEQLGDLTAAAESLRRAYALRPDLPGLAEEIGRVAASLR